MVPYERMTRKGLETRARRMGIAMRRMEVEGVKLFEIWKKRSKEYAEEISKARADYMQEHNRRIDAKNELRSEEMRRERRETRLATFACRLLIRAYCRGEVRGGSMEWSEVDDAYEQALHAFPQVYLEEESKAKEEIR